MGLRAYGLLFLVSAVACVFAVAADAAARVTPGNDDFEQHMSAGKASYGQAKLDDAIREFRAAVDLRPNDSMAHLWLGRALGRKTEQANPLSAAFTVGNVRDEFERAVALDPRNLEARSALMEFYLDAPASFGGGLDRARQQAEAMAKLDPAAGHWARARIAEKQKRYDVAEHEYRAAVKAEPANEEYRKDLEEFVNKYGSGQRK